MVEMSAAYNDRSCFLDPSAIGATQVYITARIMMILYVSARLYIVGRAANAIYCTPSSRVATSSANLYHSRSARHQVKQLRALELRDVRRGTYSVCRAWPGLLDEVRET